MTATAAATRWTLRGTGFEFCDCAFGCGCNFCGFPSSKDGSCRAFIGVEIVGGSCGDVNLSGVQCAAILDWPKAIHDGNGKCAFVVDPATTDEQIEALAWKRGECGQGSFKASASGVSIGADNSNWILYEFDWSNA